MDRLDVLLEQVASVLGAEICSCARLQEGKSHQVYKISTEGGKSYSLRIPNSETATLIAKRGTALLTALKDGQPRLPVPLVIYESEHFSILQFLEGEPLQSWNNVNLSTNRRKTLLAGFGEFLFRVWTAAIGPSVPASVGCTYRTWLVEEVDKGLRRSLGDSGWGDPIHFLHRRTMIRHIVPDHGNTMTALKHGDLNAWNVLVDETGFTGVIDWDTAQLVPLAAAVQHPLFIADIPGWQNDDVPPEMIFDDDRAELERIIDRLAMSSPAPAAKEIPNLLRTSRERQFFEMSLRNKRINAEYTRVKLVSSPINKVLALQSLGKFIRSNPDLQSDAGVLQLQTRLCCLPEA
ncbi:kinase-like domain-containing protein [Nemania sp. FL0031]|nr:kinase-like domain-containing protein [Nemania sp. FL0031]